MSVKHVSVQHNNATIKPQFQSRLKHMTYKDMKKEAILRGMKPRHIVQASYFVLLAFINEHYFDELDKTRLIKFDNWVERKSGRKMDGLYSALKMSHVKDEQPIDEVKTKNTKAKTPKVKKQKKTKNKYGIIEGTKKSLVYELVEQGGTDKRIIKNTIKRFPDAKESSIKIWIKQARKAIG